MRDFKLHYYLPGTPWDGIMERNHLADFLARRISEVRNQQVNLITEQLERHLTQQLSGPIIGLLETCTPGMWPRMYVLCDEAADVVNAALVKVSNRDKEGLLLVGEAAKAGCKHGCWSFGTEHSDLSVV